MRGAWGSRPVASRYAITTEYASCPVEHPATQTRIGFSLFAVANFGKTSFFSASKAAGFLKKPVSVISMSSCSALTSDAFRRRREAYSFSELV